jgi:hypothetical protein
VQEQQEKETELEQREEDLVNRAIHGNEREMEPAATTAAPARSFDEFRE